MKDLTIIKISKKNTFFFLKASVSFGFFYILFTKFSLYDIFDILKKSQFNILLLTILTVIAQFILAIIRWHKLLKLKNINISIKQCLKIFWIGLFFNQVLPSTIGGDAIRGYLIIKNGHNIGVTTISILLDRMFGLIGLLVLLIIIMPFFFNLLPNTLNYLEIYFLTLILAIVIIKIFFLDFILKKFIRFKFIQIISTLAKDGRKLLKNYKLGINILTLSILIHLISVITIGLIAISLNIIIPWGFLLIIVPIISLLVFIPISISGWGFREGIMVLGLGYCGVPGIEALTLSLVYGFTLLLTALPGVVLWITNTKLNKNKI